MTSAADITLSHPTPARHSNLGMVARYYLPRIKWQLILYPLVSILCTAFMVWSAGIGVPFLGLAMEWIFILMIIFAPLTLARYNARETDITLPASWGVKATFLLLYTLVIVPLMVLLLPGLSQTILPEKYCLLFRYIEAHGEGTIIDVFPGWLIGLQRTHIAALINAFVPATLCLLMVISFRHDTILKSVLWSLGVGVFYMLVQIVTSATLVFYRMFTRLDIINGNDPSTAEIEQVTEQAVNEYLNLAYGIGFPALIIIGLLLCWLVCRKVKNRNC